MTFAVLQVPVRVPAAAALWAGPQLGVEGGEGGGRLLARAGRLPHRGVEGRVVKDRDGRTEAGPGHVVQRYADRRGQVRTENIAMNLSFHIPRLNIRRLNVLAFPWKEFF